jgi:hypothetical protein
VGTVSDNLKNFVNNIGILCETWALSYEKFTQMGYDNVTALQHTQAFMASFMAAAAQSNGGRE